MAKKNKKRVLGRGLSALLDDPDREIQSISDSGADKVVGNIIDLELDKIEVNRRGKVRRARIFYLRGRSSHFVTFIKKFLIV